MLRETKNGEQNWHGKYFLFTDYIVKKKGKKNIIPLKLMRLMKCWVSCE